MAKTSVLPDMIRKYVSGNPELTKAELISRLMDATGFGEKHVRSMVNRVLNPDTPTSGGTPVSEPLNKQEPDRELNRVKNTEGDSDKNPYMVDVLFDRAKQTTDLTNFFDQRAAAEDKITEIRMKEAEKFFDDAQESLMVQMRKGEIYFMADGRTQGLAAVHKLSTLTWGENGNAKRISDDELLPLRRALVSALRAVEDELEDRDLLGRVTRRN